MLVSDRPDRSNDRSIAATVGKGLCPRCLQHRHAVDDPGAHGWTRLCYECIREVDDLRAGWARSITQERFYTRTRNPRRRDPSRLRRNTPVRAPSARYGGAIVRGDTPTPGTPEAALAAILERTLND